MSAIVHTARLEKELIARGLVPDDCTLLEVRIEPHAGLLMRYEMFVRGDRLDLFADALKAAAQQALAEDERKRNSKPPAGTHDGAPPEFFAHLKGPAGEDGEAGIP
jgi:hypothetical protein